MPRTLINPTTQVSNSNVYTSVAPPGATLQTGALTLENDLNSIRAQLESILDVTQGGNWYDPVASVNSKQRGLLQLNTGLNTIETKTLLRRVSVFTQITVPAGQNYVILTVANSQTPTAPMAIAATTIGAVVAQSSSSGSSFAGNELTVQAGSAINNPKNGSIVVNGGSRQSLETQSTSVPYDVIGLLQVESTATDGAAFNDTSGGNRLKLSFCYFNPSTNALTACAASDVGGLTIAYTYCQRYTFSATPEDAFVGTSGYVDQIGTVDITTQRAFNNQASVPVNVANSALFRIANNTSFALQNSSGTTNLLNITPSTSGNSGTVGCDTFAFQTTQTVTSTKGVSVGTAAQAINIGNTNGQIDSGGALAIKTTGSNPLNLSGGSSMTLSDGYESASTWVSSGVALSASTQEWSNYKAAYGEASLMSGIVKAGQMGSHSISTVTVTASSIAAGVTVTGAGASANLSAALPNTSASPNPASNCKVHLNGALLAPQLDYSFVSGSQTSDMTFTFALKGGSNPDVIRFETFQNPLDNF